MLDAKTDEETAFRNAMIAFYPALPETTEWDDAFRAMSSFLKGTPEPEIPGAVNASDDAVPARAYSFLYDQKAILAGFWQQYRIDLTHETLHWWVLKALLENMRDNHMADLMFFRTAEESDAMSKEQRRRARKEKRRLALPRTVAESARENALVAALLNGGDGLEELLESGNHNEKG